MIKPHILQTQELRRMRQLRNELPGNGFGYVVNEDAAVGMHTAGEIAFLAIHNIPIVTSKPFHHFRDVPLSAQDTLRNIIQEILPLDEINHKSITSLQERLAKQQPPFFPGEDRKVLSNLMRNALLEQRFTEEGLCRALITSEKGIKQRPFKLVLKEAYPSRYIALDSISANVPGIPPQPFQEQGTRGALGRISDALVKTAGFPYSQIGSFENCLVALDPSTFRSDIWATPNHWASAKRIDAHNENKKHSAYKSNLDGY